MAKVHIAHFVEIRHWIVPDDDERDEGTWQTQYRFQNANTEGSIQHEGQDYRFLSFLYQGATRTRTGDNIESALVVSTNQIAMDYAYDIVMIDFNGVNTTSSAKSQSRLAYSTTTSLRSRKS